MSDVIQPHEIQFCCGTSCDAKANFDYVKRLELEILDLEDRNKSLLAVNLHLSDKTNDYNLLKKGIESLTGDLQDARDVITEMEMTIKARDRALRMARIHDTGLIKSDY